MFKRPQCRDIKPENILIGVGPWASYIYLIDFGLAKNWYDTETGLHVPCGKSESLAGTVRYASINSHLSVAHTRRDDIESIAYNLIYLLRGFLPWQGVKGTDIKSKDDLVMEKKLSTPLDD